MGRSSSVVTKAAPVTPRLMPSTMTDDGDRAARSLRDAHPQLPMILLSQHVETRHSVSMVASGGFGYLLKDRVLRVDDFL
jgi:DNA-binding NarL/FixJ family response regulator